MKSFLERLLWLALALAVIVFGAAYIWHLYSGAPPGSLYMLP